MTTNPSYKIEFLRVGEIAWRTWPSTWVNVIEARENYADRLKEVSEIKTIKAIRLVKTITKIETIESNILK